MLSHLVSHSPWYSYFICSLLALSFSAMLYFRHKKNSEVPKRILIFLSIMRFLSSFLVVFLLLHLFLKQIKNQTEAPLVIIAVDNSASILANKDSSQLKGLLLEKIKQLKEKIGAKYDLKILLFGSTTRNSPGLPNFSDKETDMDDLMSSIETNYSNQNIGSLILMSDGIYTKGANPMYRSEKLGFPIYSIALGDSNEFKDILIQKVNHNQIAYFGNSFPVELEFISKKFKGQKVKVSLLQNGIEKAHTMVTINSDHYSSTLSFTLSAETKGIVTYQAKVEILPAEKNPYNNSQNFVIEVIDNHEKILLLTTAPHPDISAIKESILATSFYDLDDQILPFRTENLKSYSLVIFHGAGFGQQPDINRCKELGIPYWLVNPTSTDLFSGMRINNHYNKYSEAEPVLNQAFSLFQVSDGLKKFAGQLPAVKTFFGNYLLSNGIDVFLFQKIGAVETEQPILVFNESEGLKSACFLGDGLWKWNMRDFAEHHNHDLFNELISKSILYLAVKNDKSLFRVNYPKSSYENEVLEIEAELYNKSYELNNEPEVTFMLSDEKNKTFNYSFSKSEHAYRLNLGLLTPGEYHFVARAKSGQELYEKRGIIVVKEMLAEKLSTVANHPLLYQMASRSGGKLFYLNQMDALEKELLNSPKIKTITYSQRMSLRLIDLQVFFWIILCLFGIEWFVRKRFLRI